MPRDGPDCVAGPARHTRPRCRDVRGPLPLRVTVADPSVTCSPGGPGVGGGRVQYGRGVADPGEPGGKPLHGAAPRLGPRRPRRALPALALIGRCPLPRPRPLSRPPPPSLPLRVGRCRYPRAARAAGAAERDSDVAGAAERDSDVAPRARRIRRTPSVCLEPIRVILSESSHPRGVNILGCRTPARGSRPDRIAASAGPYNAAARPLFGPLPIRPAADPRPLRCRLPASAPRRPPPCDQPSRRLRDARHQPALAISSAMHFPPSRPAITSPPQPTGG